MSGKRKLLLLLLLLLLCSALAGVLLCAMSSWVTFPRSSPLASCALSALRTRDPSAQLVRDTMVYGVHGELLDTAPYPAIYEYHAQRQYEYDHPERIRAIHQLAHEAMLQAKLRMNEIDNANRPSQVYRVGDYVMLKLDHIQLPVWTVAKCRKLRGKYFGAFPVVAVHSPLAIELRLPAWMHQQIHPVFHPMYLKLASTTTVQKDLKRTLGTVFEPADFGVERILAHRIVKGRT